MAQERPNIVLIITDQQRYDTINALGYPYMHTPNLDRLVREGVSFSRNYITAASCAPARASLFSGFYPHTTGIYKNADLWRRSWVENLAAAGYHCANVGKMHTFPYETPLGFHERFVVENKDRYLEGRYFWDRWDMALQAQGLVKQQRELYRKLDDYGERLGAFEWKLPPKTHSDMFVGDTAVSWIQNKPDQQPFFLEVGFPGPHPPYDPVPEYLEYYKDEEIPIPEVAAEQLANQPAAQKELIDHNSKVDHDSVVWSKNPTDEQLRRMRKYYYANVTMIDEKIGEILGALESKGYLDNTIVIFISDHGDCMGDHGHIQKWTMYEEIVRMPMIVWAPGRFPGGRTVDAMCQQFDIAPVILEAAGAEAPDGWEAQNLMPFLTGEGEGPSRDYVYAEQSGDHNLTGAKFVTMIRSADWKLVHYLDQPDGELYDEVADPEEKNNLWYSEDPAHVAKKQDLLSELLAWRMRSDLTTAAWTSPWR